MHCCHQADVGKLRGTTFEWEIQYEMWESRSWFRVPRPVMSLGPWSSQAHEYRGAAGSHRKAENGVGASRLCLAWGRRGKWALQLVPVAIVLGLMAAGLVAVVVGSAKNSLWEARL